MSQSIREALESALDEEQEEQGIEETGRSEESTEESMGITQEVPEESPAPEEVPPAPVDGNTPPPPAEDAAPPEVEDLKAPASWKVGVREEWANLPQPVKEEVLRREKNVADILQQTAGYRKVAEEFQQMVHPFEPLIASRNKAPMDAVKELLNTVAGLSLGTAQQKAQIIANTINQYGIDIATLDGLLSGQAPDPQASQIEQLLNQRLAPMQDFMSQVQQSQAAYQQQVASSVDADVASFASSHEFYDDVRMDMADLIELAAQRGESLTLEDAYNRALAVHPEITQVISGRRQQQTAAQRQQQIAQKQAAASSVPSIGPGSSGAGAPATLRGALEDAWENAG